MEYNREEFSQYFKIMSSNYNILTDSKKGNNLNLPLQTFEHGENSATQSTNSTFLCEECT